MDNLFIQHHRHQIDLLKFKCRQIDFDNERRAAFEKEKADQEIVRQAVELEEWRQALEREREAFERERRDLERELAKYKGIVGDCLKEISTYLE